MTQHQKFVDEKMPESQEEQLLDESFLITTGSQDTKAQCSDVATIGSEIGSEFGKDLGSKTHMEIEVGENVGSLPTLASHLNSLINPVEFR